MPLFTTLRAGVTGRALCGQPSISTQPISDALEETFYRASRNNTPSNKRGSARMHWEDWERLIACAPQAISLFCRSCSPRGGPARPSALSGGTRPASERPLASPSNFQICAQSSSGQGYASPGKGPFTTSYIPFRRWPRASIGLCLGCAKADKANKGPAFRNEMRALSFIFFSL